jgi:hypothetical protein
MRALRGASADGALPTAVGYAFFRGVDDGLPTVGLSI